MIINPYAFAGPKLLLRLNFGDNTSTGTATGWSNLYAEPNPDEAAGTIDSSRGGAWVSYGNIEGSGVSIRALNLSTTATRWGIFGGGSAGNTGETTAGVYPLEVTRSLWFGHVSDPTLEIYGLNNSKTYTITLFGSRNDDVAGPRPTVYSVNGVDLAALECIGNLNNTRQRTGVAPSSGVISIQLKRTTSDFTYLNAMIIQEE